MSKEIPFKNVLLSGEGSGGSVSTSTGPTANQGISPCVKSYRVIKLNPYPIGASKAHFTRFEFSQQDAERGLIELDTCIP